MAFLVAADGAVKRTGWNYRFVLGALSAAKPPLSPDALARTIVDHVVTLEGDVSLRASIWTSRRLWRTHSRNWSRPSKR